MNNAFIVSQLQLKLDEEKWRSHFVCVITNETRSHSIPTKMCGIRMSDIAHCLHASLYRFSVVTVCCWRCCCCYALNITPNMNSILRVNNECVALA